MISKDVDYDIKISSKYNEYSRMLKLLKFAKLKIDFE